MEAETETETAGPAGGGVAAAEGRKKLRVMVALDGSEGSFYALKWALDHLFSQQLTETESYHDPLAELGTLTVVNVQPPFQPYIYPAGPVIYATPTVVESVKKAQEQNASSIFARALQMCEGKKVKTETLVFEGDPKEMICQATENMHVDLLVVASRGLSTIKRAFLGSVSDYCAHHAKSPVLIVKPPSETHK